MDHPTIMIGNDDGINNIGIDALARKALDWGEVRIVSPEKQQSARAKSMTFHKPIRYFESETKSGIPAYAFNSTPADSIIIYKHIYGTPNLVLSGINSGDNTSVHSILTSGTAAVSMEAGLQNIPAFAFSMDVPDEYFFKDDFPGDLEIASTISIKIAKMLYEKLTRDYWEKVLFFNINFPDEISQTTKIELVELETYKYNNYLVERKDPKGENYSWLWGSKREDYDTTKDSYKVYFDKIITITPVGMEHTDYLFEMAKPIIDQLNDH